MFRVLLDVIYKCIKPDRQQEVIYSFFPFFVVDIFKVKPRITTLSPGAKGLKWRFFAHESVQAEFGLKL